MGIGREHDRMWSVFEPETNFGLIYKENPDTAGMISMCVSRACVRVQILTVLLGSTSYNVWLSFEERCKRKKLGRTLAIA